MVAEDAGLTIHSRHPGRCAKGWSEKTPWKRRQNHQRDCERMGGLHNGRLQDYLQVLIADLNFNRGIQQQL